MCRPGQGIQFDSKAEGRNIFEVQSNRRQFFLSRLQSIEDTIFSHIDQFVKPKLTDGTVNSANQDLKRIYNVHAIVGQ